MMALKLSVRYLTAEVTESILKISVSAPLPVVKMVDVTE